MDTPLYDYWHVTGDDSARERSLAAIETVRRNLPAFFEPDAVWYDLEHRRRIGAVYQQVYIDQFRWLSAITGEPCFDDAVAASIADHR